MGFFSSIGGAIGTFLTPFVGPLGPVIGAGLGGALDGKKARKAQSRAIAEQNRIATIAAENASRPVSTTQEVDFEGTIKSARNAGFNPLTALRATGGNITGTTTRYVAPLLSSMPTRNFTDIMSDAFSGYQSFQNGRTQKLKFGLETDLLRSQIAMNLKNLEKPNFPRFSEDGTKIEPAFIDTRYPDGSIVRIPNPELYEMGPFELLVGTLLQGGSATADAMGGDSFSPAQVGKGIKKVGDGIVTSASSFKERFMHGFTTGQWVFPKTVPIKNNFKTEPNYNEPIVPYSMKALGLEY